MRPRWPQDGSKLGQDALRYAKKGRRWLKMGKMNGKITQEGGKMRKMRDVSSGLPTLGGHESAQPANSTASRGPGEVPPLGRGNPSRRRGSNPYSRRSEQKSS